MAKCLECDTRASYNKESEKVGIYCFKHKKEDMVNVVSPKCIEKDCKTQPKFNIDGEKK